MKSSFVVFCGVVLLCFGSVRCKRHFSEDGDNSLDKTKERDDAWTEKEEKSERKLYNPRMTNVLSDLSFMHGDTAVPEEKCKEELEICAETGGTCISKEDEQIECKCPIDKEFDEYEGCKYDKCFTLCGIPHTDKEGDVKCMGGPFGNVTCQCTDAENAFDPEDKECKTDYCKEKCGESTSVKCLGNKFVEYAVVCKCRDVYDDFISIDKECKTNYCYKVCGFHHRVKCDGDPYKTKTTADCGCDDNNYLYKNRVCREKCSDDDDCEHEGKCKGDDGNKLCECTRFTTGDKCETIDACLFGKYSHCKGKQGKCVFNKDKSEKAECVCPDGKKLYETIGYCAAKCKEDKDCAGSNRKCNGDKFCICNAGYEGEDCNEVTGCIFLTYNCTDIGMKCVFDESNPGKGKCECKDGYTYNREVNKCQDPYCYPNSPCKEGECKYKDSLGGGYCECEKNKYYNYKTEKCEDLSDKCLLRKTPCGENEKCEKGECKCKYQVKKGEKCERNFCALNLCFTDAKCKEENGTCYCEEGKFYKDKECQDAKCLKDFKEKCACPSGTMREEEGDECVPAIEEEVCSKNCGYGICMKKNNKETCKCFTDIADSFRGKCILRKSYYCPGGILQAGLMKCRCEGQYTQAEDDITCRLKTCDDDGVKEDCASKGAECEMNWKAGGYFCRCPEGYGIGANGKCTDVCSIERNVKTCVDKGMFCYNTISSKNPNTGTCGCPPTLKGGKCSEKAENVYLFKNIPVLKKRYEITTGINKVLLSADLMNSLELTFNGAIFESGYLYDYRIEGSLVNCSVWINFKSAPTNAELDKLKLVPKTVLKACDGCEESAVVWPPNILLSENGLIEAVPTKLDFCSNEVKDQLCGKGAMCKDNKCTCKEGFKSIQFSNQKISDYEIQRCEDIDECALGIDICSSNTNTHCVNTFGSYKCVCKEGFQKKYTPMYPETDKYDCYDMCSPSPCVKGKCSLKNNTFDCQCETGVSGTLCDRENENYKSAKKGTAAVGGVLGTLLAIIVIAVIYYFIKRRGGK